MLFQVARNVGFRPIALSLGLIAATCFAQTKVKIFFDGAGSREIWFGQADRAASAPTPATGADIEVDLAGHNAPEKFLVRDLTTGNLAITELKSLAGSTTGWKVPSASFVRIYRTTVRVEHSGKPVAAATVTVNEQSQLLAPDDKGEVSFYGLAPGSLKVKVRYKSKDQMISSPAQTFEIGLKRDKPEPILTIAIPDDVAVIEPKAASHESSPVLPQKEEPKTSPIGSFVVLIVSLGAGLGAIYLILRYVQKNQDLVQEKLEKLGVSIPKPGDDADAVPLATAPPAPEPIKPIILEDASPQAGVPIPATVGNANPKLVRELGESIMLGEGVSTVGREAPAEIVLSGESTVSRKHAEISNHEGVVTVRDLGSTNGSFVNGVQLSSEVVLQPGDTIQFGAVRFRYEV